jgi:hypothetical protein
MFCLRGRWEHRSGYGLCGWGTQIAKEEIVVSPRIKGLDSCVELLSGKGGIGNELGLFCGFGNCWTVGRDW